MSIPESSVFFTYFYDFVVLFRGSSPLGSTFGEHYIYWSRHAFKEDTDTGEKPGKLTTKTVIEFLPYVGNLRSEPVHVYGWGFGLGDIGLCGQ